MIVHTVEPYLYDQIMYLKDEAWRMGISLSGGRTTKQIEFGQMKTLTTYRNNPALPETTTWNYDVFGHLSSKKYANNSQVPYVYNDNNQLLSRSWARGRTTAYTYDGAGRLKTTTYNNPETSAITYTYNRLWQLAQVVDAAGTRTLAYNPDGTPATETVPNVSGHNVTHTYDTLGRETALKLMNGATALYNVGYTYDNMSRLATATFANQSATFSRVNGSNRLNTTVFKNGTTAIHTATRSYDNFNRLLGVNGYTYTYNDKDERTKQALADGNYWDYGYDTLGQVTSGAKKTSAGVQVSGQNYGYTYDTIGNRITATANSAVTNYTANDVNQYTAIGSVAPTYDTDGNMLTGYNGWTMEWNGENRLKTIYNATTKLEFAYDYMGRRFSKKVYTKSGTSWVLSTENAFAYNGYKQIAEYTVSGTTKTLSKSTVWQPAASGDLDVVLWYRDGSTVYTLLPDGNKNTRQLKTTAGTVVATYDYDPFGNIIATTGTVLNPWKFSSEYHDSETGLVYYNYRDYAPSLGRWIIRDPIGEKGGVNLYCIVKNMLIKVIDDIGLIPIVIDIDEVVRVTMSISSITVKKKDILWLALIDQHLIPDFIYSSEKEKDSYGHWWIEMGRESYGWWPKTQVNLWSTLISIEGELNGITTFGGTPSRDPHHGEYADSNFHPQRATSSWYDFWSDKKLQYGRKKGLCCPNATEEDIKDCIRNFAKQYSGSWSYPWGQSCHTFVDAALNDCCLEEP